MHAKQAVYVYFPYEKKKKIGKYKLQWRYAIKGPSNKIIKNVILVKL